MQQGEKHIPNQSYIEGEQVILMRENNRYAKDCDNETGLHTDSLLPDRSPGPIWPSQLTFVYTQKFQGITRESTANSD